MKLIDLLQKNNEGKNIDIEKCYRCGHIAAKSSMQEVKEGDYMEDIINSKCDFKYYCFNCKIGHDYRLMNVDRLRYYKKRLPYVEVYKNGDIIPICNDKKCPRTDYLGHNIICNHCISDPLKIKEIR